MNYEPLEKMPSSFDSSESMSPKKLYSEGEKLPISLCMIVKNEEKYLAECLRSVQNLVSEIIIVDTGSTDSTIQIAESFGAKIFHFDWINDFSAARNYSLEQATQPFILQLDADEEIFKTSIPWFYESFPYENDGYFMEIHNLKDLTKRDVMASHFLIRFFKNDPTIRFINAVHENISLKNVDLGYSSALILHKGYADNERKVEKSNRNFALLKQEFREDPNSPFVHFYFAQQYYACGDSFNAFKAGKKALKLGLKPPVQGTALRITMSYASENRLESELQALLDIAPSDDVFPERTLYEAFYAYQTNDFDTSMTLVNRFVHLVEHVEETKVNRFSYDGVLPDNYRLGLEIRAKLHIKIGNINAAIDDLVQALRIAPSSWTLKALLGQLLFMQEKFSDSIGVFSSLVKDLKQLPAGEGPSELIEKYENIIEKIRLTCN